MGGAAYVAGRSSACAARREEDQEQAIAELQAQRQHPAAAPGGPCGAERAPAPPVPPAAGAPSITGQPARLGELAHQGPLTPEGFAPAKARLLGV
ncbi:SHOCT domain-containing protein [Streptomyces tanashiensis]|uniref:SHOCT domain-containing protein n=1 Tax=Streptomyces tanashiensis TaxID=67367 RepID=UPI00167D7780|nr:SHOCT domain-containing protein [Streptomyces tanashiensis]GGY18631.1 hypothetical protein GCM10010299_25360 [Streptomyces tanashiensis]